ncbi:glycosyltransferase [Selenomonas ruminantium]|uniref:glycosyltransferase n=1 Tax=Selenomonas ruminantium TaxID=971 RepID=UPI0026EBECED|nr:glycosyltransferase [Selenomonas ruminantium]
MDKIKVIMSTYNGEKNIIKQLNSIFNQKNVLVSVYIRDDHSTDNTVEVIKSYSKEHPNYDLTLSVGDNLGYAKSFWTALKNCGESDYYAFSDQDDIWDESKLYECVKVFSRKDYNIPQLSYCQMIRSDEKLNPLKEQVNILSVDKLTKKIVFTKTFNYGAGTIINTAAKNLICRHWPNNKDLPHDMWFGLLCFWFGRVYFVEKKLYYWIRYSHSVTGEGTKWSGQLYRFKQTIQGKSYVNVAEDLLKYYSDLLDDSDRRFLNQIITYRSNFTNKLLLLMDKEFCRDNFIGTVVLKVGILLGWY